MSRKQAIVARYIRLGIIALFLLLFVIITVATKETAAIITLSVTTGIITYVVGNDQVCNKFEGIFKFILVVALGPIFAIQAIFNLLKEVKRLNTYGDDFSTNFQDIITWTSGEQFKVIARVFCKSNFYCITQPYPLPRNFNTNDVIVYRMYKKKGATNNTYAKTTSAEFKAVMKTYKKLLKAGKLKVNALQKSIYDMNVNELKQYITTNKYQVRNLEYFDSESKKSFLLNLTIGYELKIVFGDPKDSSKWSQEQLTCVARYYTWQINWDSSLNVEYVVGQAERLEINRFYRLCKALDNVIDEQKMGTRDLMTMQAFGKLLETV